MIAVRPFAKVQPSSRGRHRVANTLAGAVVIVGASFNAVVGVLSLFAPGTFLTAVGQSTPVVVASATVFAEYAGARELAVALILLVCAAMRIGPVLAGVLLVAAAANALDAASALATSRWVQMPGAVVFAAAFAFAAAWYARQTLQPARKAWFLSYRERRHQW